MANETEKRRAEIEIAVRDSFSTSLKELGKQLDAANKRAVELGTGGAGSFDKFRKSNDQLRDSTKKTAESFTFIETAAATLGRSLLGPIGVAAGFVAVAKAMSEVANDTVRLKNFSIDTGLAIGKIHDLQQTLRRGGFSSSEGDTIIGSLGKMANNLSTFKEASNVYQDLMKAPGGAAIAENLKNIAKTGDQQSVINEFLKTFNKQTREGKIFMAEIAGVTVSGLQRMADAANNAKNIKVWEVSQDEAQKYLNFWVDAETQFKNIFTNISNHTLEALNKITQAFRDEGVTSKGIAEFINGEIDAVIKKVKDTVEEFKAIKAWFDTLPGNFRSATGIGKEEEAYGYGGDIGKTNSKPKIQFFNPGFKLNNPFSNPGTHPDITDFGGMRRNGGGEDGVRLLTDIRDSLQRIELKDDEGGGSGGSNGTGGASTYGTGARGGALQGGMGGFRGFTERGGGFKTSRRGSPSTTAGGSDGMDPGMPNSSSGASGASPDSPVGTGKFDRSSFDEEFKNDPNLAERLQTIVQGEVGHKASAQRQRIQLETIFNRAKARNQTLAEVTRMYTGPGSAGYYPSSTFSGGAIKNREEYEKFQREIMGPVRAGSDVSTETLGFPATGNASAGVAARGAASGRYTRFGQIDPNRRPGEPGVETYVQEGSRRENIGRLEASRARETVDQTQSMGGPNWGKGQINAEVRFTDVPHGWKTSADVEGDVFKDLQISKTKQSGVYRQPSQAYD